MASNQVNYQLYVTGQLKSNVQSRLDYLSGVFTNLSEVLSEVDSENKQMREFITILLHFKYMLQYLRSNLIRDDELFKRLGPDVAILFKTDFKTCISKFQKVIESSQCFDFVAEKNDYYQLNGAYCSYHEEDILYLRQKKGRSELASTSSPAKQQQQPKQSIATHNHSAASENVERNCHEVERIHPPIKIEPEVEIIELARSREASDSFHSSDDSRNDSRSTNQHQLQAQHAASTTEKSSSSASSSSNHKSRDKSNTNSSNNNNSSNHSDLRLTIITTPQSSRKVVKRSAANSFPDAPEEMPSTSRAESGNYSKRPKRSNLFANERQQSQDEDYDFDYEKEDYEFDEEEFAAINAGQLRCPQSGCPSVFDTEAELSEHLSTVNHFNMAELVVPTYDCLVEGCNEKFPNLARANVHMRNTHPDAYITCEQCQKQVKAHYLRKHIYMRHRKGEYKCSQDCDYVAEYYHELEKHRYMMHYNRYNWPEQGSGGGGGGVVNPIAVAIANQQANSCGSSNNNSEDIPMQTRFRRFVCKFNDCNFLHESRSRVLKHIRMHHLGGAQTSRNGLPVGNPAEDRAALEYLDIQFNEFPDNSFFD